MGIEVYDVHNVYDVYNLYVLYDVNDVCDVYDLYVVYDVNNVFDVNDIILMKPSGQLTNHIVTLWVNWKTTSLFSLGIIGELGKWPLAADVPIECGRFFHSFVKPPFLRG